MIEFILICFLIGFIIIIGFVIKKTSVTNAIKDIKPHTEDKRGNIDAYKIYSDWCKNENKIPITKEEFDTLANIHGRISLADVMNKHRNNNSYQKEEGINEAKNNSVSEYENRLQKEKDEQKKRDEEFAKSAFAGYITNSTTKGTLIGGNLLGGLFGDYLNKKPKK